MSTAAACWTAALVLAAVATAARGLQLLLPGNFTALSGDFRVAWNLTDLEVPARLQIVRITGSTMAVLGSTPVSNITDEGSLPCKLVNQGGRYGVRLVGENATRLTELMELDVRWPPAKVTLNLNHVVTYPDQSVIGTLEFSDLKCRSPKLGIPEFWLELLYCGHSPLGCVDSNTTHRQVLHAEQVRGYPRRRVTLGCELFGLAGFYALTLRAALPTAHPVNASTFLKASWSDKFVFNVYGRSIFPCDAHSGGVETVFQYPKCRLQGSTDRVRLFARLRADVSSLQPPTSLHYISEQRVAADQHHLHFDCDLFSEKYVEYCFVYVSQAITGAMADVRMDCVPTLPVIESDSGGWGAWSPWTPCSTTCPGGTRSRYRFCDSPQPRYGAKFCEGKGLQSESCGGHGDTWDCPFDSYDSLAVDRPDVLAAVGIGCRCGCVVHLGPVNIRKVLATSALSCPGRTFWLIQAEPGHVIRLSVEHIHLPCDSQWLKVRDGDSLIAQLLAHLTGSPRGPPTLLTSTENYLLMEFNAGEQECGGGFLAQAQQIPPQPTNWTDVSVAVAPQARLSVVPQAVLLFMGLVFLVTAGLAAQYLFRYRKYQLAVANLDSRSRATSRATLLSDVISLARGVGGARHHVTLVEEDESEHEYETVRSFDPEEIQVESSASAKDTSASETEHVRPNIGLISGKPKRGSKKDKRFKASEEDKESSTRPTSSNSSRRLSIVRTPSATTSVASSAASASSVASFASATSGASVATLTNGCISPAVSVNVKDRKDKRNLERLLKGATSEFSLGGPESSDLELDYYDYNVSNAGAVPGSFLGMDPAYLVWIPPFAPGCWDTDDELLNLNTSPSHDHEMQDFSGRGDHQSSDSEEQVTELGEDADDSVIDNVDNKRIDKTVSKSPKTLTRAQNDTEKETRFEKSPSVDAEYYDLLNTGDIKFADDEEDDGSVVATPNKRRHIKA